VTPSSLFGWVKGTGGGILSKVAERTKSSVESVITTLDPQMKVLAPSVCSNGILSVDIYENKSKLPLSLTHTHIHTQANIIHISLPREPFLRERLSTIDLIVSTSIDLQFLILQTFFFSKQATLIRRSTVLSLPLQLAFPGLAYKLLNATLGYFISSCKQASLNKVHRLLW